MVGSQIGNLTLDLSFGHNLCFRCSNGSYEPILDIYISRDFQWYKECFNTLSFDPCNYSLKIWESIWDSNSQDESSLGSVRVHSLTFFCTIGSMKCDSRASLLAHTLASPCLGHEPKARVATHNFTIIHHDYEFMHSKTFVYFDLWCKFLEGYYMLVII
jgi:hypothetical protein